MARKKPHSTDKTTPSLAEHLVTLAWQAADQVLELALTMDTHAALESAQEPERQENTVDFLVPPSQLFVLRRALLTEMRLQVKALAHTTDALYVCAAELAAKR